MLCKRAMEEKSSANWPCILKASSFSSLKPSNNPLSSHLFQAFVAFKTKSSEYLEALDNPVSLTEQVTTCKPSQGPVCGWCEHPPPPVTVQGCVLGLQPVWAKDSLWNQISGILFFSCFATINTIITISVITLAIYYCYLTYNDNLHYCMRAYFYSKQPHWIRKIYWQSGCPFELTPSS